MNLDGYHGPGRVLVLRGPRGWGGILIGHIWRIELVVACAVTGWATVAAYDPDHPVSTIGFSIVVFAVVLGLLWWMTVLLMIGLHLKGHDAGAGLPLAELSPEGVRVRYRQVRPRERRRGIPDTPSYDAAAPWPAITGWRHGRGPYGEPVIVLDLTDPAEVVHNEQRQAPPAGSYLARLQATTSSPLAVRMPATCVHQFEAVCQVLADHGINERPD